MSTAEARASQEAIESAVMDELVRSGLLTPERLIALGVMQKGEDMAELIDRGEISLQNLAEVGFEIDAAEAAVLTAEAQEMLVAAGIIQNSEDLPLEFSDHVFAVDLERDLVAMRAVREHEDEEEAGKKEDLKRTGGVLVKLLFEDGLISKKWLVESGIVRQGETRTFGELVESDEISLDVLREHRFTITEDELFSLQIGPTGEKICTMMGLVERGDREKLSNDPDPEAVH